MGWDGSIAFKTVIISTPNNILYLSKQDMILGAGGGGRKSPNPLLGWKPWSLGMKPPKAVNNTIGSNFWCKNKPNGIVKNAVKLVNY